MHENLSSAIVPIVFVLLVLLGMLIAWRRRMARDARLSTGASLPAEEGERLFGAAAFYVASTKAGYPLERLAIRGLAFRARADVDIVQTGLCIAIPGQEVQFIPRSALTDVDTATVTIDRVVERGGLVRVGWRASAPGGERVDVDSYFRVIDPEDRVLMIHAIEQVLPVADEDHDRALRDTTRDTGPYRDED